VEGTGYFLWIDS